MGGLFLEIPGELQTRAKLKKTHPMSEKTYLLADAPSRACWTDRFRWLRFVLAACSVIAIIHHWQYHEYNHHWKHGDPLAEKDRYHEKAVKILNSHPLIDGHNDLLIMMRERYAGHITDGFIDKFEHGGLEGQVDVPRIKDGHMGGAFWSAFWLCQNNISDYSDEAYGPGTKLFQTRGRSFHVLIRS